jgi:hypothetical protein
MPRCTNVVKGPLAGVASGPPEIDVPVSVPRSSSLGGATDTVVVDVEQVTDGLQLLNEIARHGVDVI